MSKKLALPEGYTSHNGGECPVSPTTRVDAIIRTAEGLAHSPGRANLHEWNASAHPDGIGAVIGYRVITNAEEQTFSLHARWAEFQ